MPQPARARCRTPLPATPIGRRRHSGMEEEEEVIAEEAEETTTVETETKTTTNGDIIAGGQSTNGFGSFAMLSLPIIVYFIKFS